MTKTRNIKDVELDLQNIKAEYDILKIKTELEEKYKPIEPKIIEPQIVQESKIKPVTNKKLSFKDKLNTRFRSKKVLMINMELVSGEHMFFVAPINDGCFTWSMMTYVVDESFKYYNISFKMWCLDYHQSLSIPIKRQINPEAIKKEMVRGGVTDIDMAFNPTTLKLFIESQVIQKVIKGADLDKVMEFIKRLLILILIIVLITFGIILKGSGMLSNIHIPGLS